VFLPRQEGFVLRIGSDEDMDLAFEEDQTLDALHASIAYHKGFRGWTIEDHETSFGTHVGDQRLQKGRAHLLQDRQEIRLGGGIVQMQFYLAETLWKRMNTAGITKGLKVQRRKDAGGKGEEEV
jgi:predicted component of type VI protein secretion system